MFVSFFYIILKTDLHYIGVEYFIANMKISALFIKLNSEYAMNAQVSK